MKVIRLSFLFFVISFLVGCLEASREAHVDIVSKYGDTTVLYATSWCGYCEKTRELLDSNYIKYIEVDIEASNEGRFEFDKLGGKGIPLVLIKGRVVEGYAPKAVLKLARGT
ncbi:MAG: mycoredoxin [Flavobacteriales bacterium]|jgi:mycoredoxin